MINNIILVGRITKDLELRYTPAGKAYCRFTLAVNRKYSQGGQQDADFITVVAWNKTAENLTNFQGKGSLIGVEGNLRTGSYEGQDGKKVYTTEVFAESIQFLGSRKDGQTNQQNHGQYQSNSQQDPFGYQSPSQQDPFAQQEQQQADPFGAYKNPNPPGNNDYGFVSGQSNNLLPGVTEDDLPF